MLRPSRPRISRAIRPNGVQPPARSGRCAHVLNQVLPLPGGLPPRRTAIGAGTGKPRRHDRPSFLIERDSAPPAPACPGQSYVGVRRCNPRCEDGRKRMNNARTEKSDDFCKAEKTAKNFGQDQINQEIEYHINRMMLYVTVRGSGDLQSPRTRDPCRTCHRKRARPAEAYR